MAEQEIKRQTAYKCNIATINKGIFVKKEGWESNYIMTEFGDFSRTNIIAVIVGKEENSVVLDDGTGQITGRMFDHTQDMQQFDIGSLVIVIGRPREFGGKIYLTIELIKNIDQGWIAYRKKELSLIKKIRELETKTPTHSDKILEPEIVENTSTLNVKDKISKLITDLDRGEGALIEDVLKVMHIPNCEEILSDMIMRGDIYESKAGHVKLM